MKTEVADSTKPTTTAIHKITTDKQQVYSKGSKSAAQNREPRYYRLNGARVKQAKPLFK